MDDDRKNNTFVIFPNGVFSNYTLKLPATGGLATNMAFYYFIFQMIPMKKHMRIFKVKFKVKVIIPPNQSE